MCIKENLKDIEEGEEDDMFREVRYVRFYHEYILPGGR